jgi:hypothetical protein
MEAGEMLTKDTRMFRDSMRYVALAARQLFAVTFIIASAGHFTAPSLDALIAEPVAELDYVA